MEKRIDGQIPLAWEGKNRMTAQMFICAVIAYGTNVVPLCSATRTRTGVYGVRGRCPRPLDDSTLVTTLFFESECKGTAFF